MLTQSKATIFLSADRKLKESDTYRSYNCLGSAGRESFGAMVLFEEITLAGSKSCIIDAGGNLDYLILPIVGTLYFESGKANNLVNPGQALVISPIITNDLIITNPYGDELVNFLQVGFRRLKGNTPKTVGIFSFDIDNSKNKMLRFGHEFCDDGSFRKYSIGKFDGRAETIYPLASEKNGVFVFVITGAFEVQYRLLEGRDGLALWDLKEMELEALSNDAIIFAVEMILQEE